MSTVSERRGRLVVMLMIFALVLPMVLSAQTKPAWPLQCERSVIHLEWQYERGNPSVMSALETLINNLHYVNTYDRGFAKLLDGQKYDARETYKHCRKDRGEIWGVVISASQQKCDQAALKVALRWQKGNNGGTLLDASNAYEGRLSKAEQKPYKDVIAMYHLMNGQHHNPQTMSLYRACFRKDPTSLFGMAWRAYMNKL